MVPKIIVNPDGNFTIYTSEAFAWNLLHRDMVETWARYQTPGNPAFFVFSDSGHLRFIANTEEEAIPRMSEGEILVEI